MKLLHCATLRRYTALHYEDTKVCTPTAQTRRAKLAYTEQLFFISLALINMQIAFLELLGTSEPFNTMKSTSGAKCSALVFSDDLCLWIITTQNGKFCSVNSGVVIKRHMILLLKITTIIYCHSFLSMCGDTLPSVVSHSRLFAATLSTACEKRALCIST